MGCWLVRSESVRSGSVKNQEPSEDQGGADVALTRSGSPCRWFHRRIVRVRNS